MGNMLYNGVELPDINTVWTDKTTYPYAFIQTTTNGGACLRISSAIPYNDGTYIRSENTNYSEYDFFAGNTVWEFYRTSVNYTGPYFAIEHSLWASADILNTDGTVYLAASDPVDPNAPAEPDTPHITTSSGNGFALYNGVKLPKLPEYNAEVYQYVGVGYLQAGVNKYAVSAFVNRPYVSSDGAYLMSPVAQTYKSWYLSDDGTTWEEQADSSTLTGNIVVYLAVLTYTYVGFDLLNEDGSVYLSASDPIPLDGMTVIEWDGDTTGLVSDTPAEMYYKISDTILTQSNFRGTIIVVGDDSGSEVLQESGEYLIEEDGVILSDTRLLASVSKSNAVSSDFGTTFPETGLYTMYIDGYMIFAYPASGESEPTYDRTAFLSGLAMGLIGKGNPTFEGSGKMLYNGVELPALPELPYLYAVIEYADNVAGGGKLARLLCSSEPIQTGVNKTFVNYYAMLGNVQIFGFATTNDVWDWSFSMNEPYPPLNEWVKIGEAHYDERTNINEQILATSPIWSNHRVVYSDDTVTGTPGATKLEASDPVPVEDTFTKGYHVGSELRRKRVLPNSNE